jgi:hypothetical protein
MGLAGADVLGVCVGSEGDCPEGITIGADAASLRPLVVPLVSLPPLSFSPPPKISFGGQPKSVGGQFVLSDDPAPALNSSPPNCVTSFVLLLLLLLVALATPAGASATVAATTPATAKRMPVLISSGYLRRC